MTNSRKTWLEVSLNGAHSKADQPNGPHEVSRIVEEGIACAEAGAGIVHFHAFDGDSDQQVYDADTYGRIIEGIRKHSDAIIYGTVPMIGGFAGAPQLTPQERYRPSEELLKSGLLEWFVVDAGLVNFTTYGGVEANAPTGMYLNPVDYVRYAMELAKTHDAHPTCGVWEAGFLRTASAVAEACGLTKDVLFKFVFSETMAFGFPPEGYALDGYQKLAAQFAGNSPWMIAAAGGDVLPLIPQALKLGGHVRIGLEDAKGGCPNSNLELVNMAISAITDAGGTLQTSAGIRSELKSKTHI